MFAGLVLDAEGGVSGCRAACVVVVAAAAAAAGCAWDDFFGKFLLQR